jgi:ectoine hydroxylase-related dioxygenase (phytanoyl-CoA dioxygenase family)
VLRPWVGDIARHPRILDAFEDLIGPDILCYSMAFRAKESDGATYAGWHQDSAYSRIRPLVVLGALALSDCTPESGCLRVIPGSHKWGGMPHAETGDAASILARGQYISANFDSSRAVDFVLRPGEIGFCDYRIIHGSGSNRSGERRLVLLVEMMPASARQTEGRESAMLARGEDRQGNFDTDLQPDGELTGGGPGRLAPGREPAREDHLQR